VVWTYWGDRGGGEVVELGFGVCCEVLRSCGCLRDLLESKWMFLV
jgi:hypothetical protein